MHNFKLLNSRYGLLAWIALIVVLIGMVVRMVLIQFEGGFTSFDFRELSAVFVIGFIYDLAAFAWMIIPFSIAALVSPGGSRGRKVHAVISTAFFVIFVGALVFQSASEFVFWNEFSSRFNFIAVDYLIFTREVIGNIEQSYSLVPMFTGMAAAALIFIGPTIKPYWRSASATAPPLKVRMIIFVALSLLPVISFFGIDETLHKKINKPSVRELAGNGTYSLFRAYRNNELSYDQYYKTLDEKKVNRILKDELLESGGNFTAMPSNDTDIMLRHIPASGSPIRKNVVLISIESLGSDFVDAFDGKNGLTPNLNHLATESLIFKNIYATGLRTVRGLEAITLSVPPTPGRAVPMRVRNKGLLSLGKIFQDNGYEALYLYGGYSMFDNMKDFFQGNGYTVVDRSAIPSSQISHETIWGVADEDLYHLALKELDQRFAKGKPFFAHIMTTSNHRPYTYPDGRVSIPSHTSRKGAVQYTDWAVGEFMRQVRRRPWYKDTIFVITGDHTAHGRGRIDLPPENYRIPLIIHAPGILKPGVVDDVASQIDIAPTLLALLNFGYDSHFFGQNILTEAHRHPRAFIANYLTVGYMEDGLIVELGPREYVRVVNAASGQTVDTSDKRAAHLIEEAISYYQNAAEYIDHGTKEKIDGALHANNSGKAKSPM